MMKLKGKKISEVEQRHELTGKELLPFAEDGKNGSMSIDTIAAYTYDKEGGDFTSRLAYDVQVPGVELIADRSEKDALGNIITNTYLTRSGAKNAMNEALKEQLPDAVANINDGFVTPNMLSEETKLLFGSETITNFPDNEDITVNQSNQLTFADKEYNPITYSGTGRKILRKNMVNGVNVLIQQMISNPNTIYIIQYDYDLNGAEIKVPEGCTLDFQGGRFINGDIILNNTSIKSPLKQIFVNVNIKGYYNEKFNAVWAWGYTNEDVDLSTIPTNLLDFNGGVYKSSKPFSKQGSINWSNGTLCIPSIKLNSNSIASYGCSSTGIYNSVTLDALPDIDMVGKILAIKTSTKVPIDWRDDANGVPTLYKGLTTICDKQSDVTLTTSSYIEKFAASTTYNGNIVNSTLDVHEPIRVDIRNMNFVFLAKDKETNIAGSMSVGHAVNLRILDSTFKPSAEAKGSNALLSITKCVGGIISKCVVADTYYEDTRTSYGIQLNASSNIIINNSFFKNNRRGVDFSGEYESRYNVVENCVFDGRNMDGDGAACGGHSTSYKNIYRNNIINSSNNIGIQCRGSYEIVEGNTFNGSYTSLISTGYMTRVLNNSNVTSHNTDRTGLIFTISGESGLSNTIEITGNRFVTRKDFATVTQPSTTAVIVMDNIVNFTPNASIDCSMFRQMPILTYRNNKINKSSSVKSFAFLPKDSTINLSTMMIEYLFDAELKGWNSDGAIDLPEEDVSKITINNAKLYIDTTKDSILKYQCILDFTISSDLTAKACISIKDMSYYNPSVASVYSSNTPIMPIVKYITSIDGEKIDTNITLYPGKRVIYIGYGDLYNNKLKAGKYKLIYHF